MTEGVWSPLSDTDPVPGDPWKVNELGSHFVEQTVVEKQVPAP